MRKARIMAVVILAGLATPAVGAEPDLSTATLTMLDNRLWSAGENWQPLFDSLPRAQQEALVTMNDIVRVVPTLPTALPPACEWVGECERLEEADRTIGEVAPPASNRPDDKDIIVQAPPPYVCGSAQGEVRAYTRTGKMVLKQLDYMNYCVDLEGKFNYYHHGHDAATFGWAWQVGNCICQERADPPIAMDTRVHSFHSQQTYFRQFGVGDFGFTDHDETYIEGYAKANGPNDGNHYIFGY